MDTDNPALQAKNRTGRCGWQFVPGAVNGQPGETDTTLSVHVALQPIPDSQQLSVLVEDVRTGGTLSGAAKPPRSLPVYMTNGT